MLYKIAQFTREQSLGTQTTQSRWDFISLVQLPLLPEDVTLYKLLNHSDFLWNGMQASQGIYILW